MSGRARLGRRDRVLAFVALIAAAGMTRPQRERLRVALVELFGYSMTWAEPVQTPQVRMRHADGWRRCPSCAGMVLVDCVDGMLCGASPERDEFIAHCPSGECGWEGPERELAVGRPHVVQHIRRTVRR